MRVKDITFARSDSRPPVTDPAYQSQIQALGWAELRQLWAGVLAGDTPGWEPGKAFEYLILRAFELDEAAVRYPFMVDLFDEPVEQLDGVVHVQHLTCLIESKHYATKVNFEPIAKLRNQLLRRHSGAIGSVFSVSGFTEPALVLADFTAPQAVLLWDQNDINFVLDAEKICNALLRKYRHFVEEGHAYFVLTSI